MTRTRSAALGLLVLALSGCAADAAPPADSAPPTPAASVEPSPTATAAPAPTSGTASPAEPVATASPRPLADGWERFEVGDGHTSWRMPPGWSADIEAEALEGRVEWTDYRGLVRDEVGVPMLQFEAIASGGQYATDFSPCERPDTEVLEVTPLGEQVTDPDAVVASVAFHESRDGRDGVTFAAGVSENDVTTACEPGILALYQGEGPSDYDYLLLQIVDDAGSSYPRFASFDEARGYLATSEYALIREVLLSFESR